MQMYAEILALSPIASLFAQITHTHTSHTRINVSVEYLHDYYYIQTYISCRRIFATLTFMRVCEVCVCSLVLERPKTD